MKIAGFFWKIFGGTVTVILITAFVVYLATLPTIGRNIQRNIETRVSNEARLASELCFQSLDQHTSSFDLGSLERLSKGLPDSRLTLIAADGEVLFDSRERPENMDNHKNRAEIMTTGKPVTRFSRTLLEDMVYVAYPIHVEGQINGYARVAVSADDREERTSELGQAIRNGAMLAILISFLLAIFFARRVTKPISEIAGLVTEIGAHNTKRRLEIRSDDELGRLAEAVNHMADELQGQISRVVRDRTEREAIFSAMSDGLLAVDTNQRVLFINKPARQLMGELPGQIKGTPVWELTRNRELLQVIEHCLESADRVVGETRIAGESGDHLVELVAVPMGASKGPHKGCVLELRDVTALRRLEAIRQDFVSNVSHELKTPLTAMRGYTESMLEDEDMPESVRKSFLEKAHLNTERLTAIVSDLLSLSRIQSDEHELSFEPLVLNELAQMVVQDMNDLAGSKHIRLELAPYEGDLSVDADAEALSMAISNLVSNAIRYSPQGETVRIAIRAELGEARIDVEDRGQGIPEDEQERVFERFYRIDKARSRKLGGTGLGLAIVKNVMATHGGRIELHSIPGEGSRFSLFLKHC